MAEHWGTGGATYVIVAQIHGDECAPSLVVDEIRNNPPTGYNVWLIPTLNPDGYARTMRKNANGVNLNADGYRHGQPETQALFDFIAEIQPTLTIHVHSPNGFIGWYGGDLAKSTGERIARAMGLRFSFAGQREDKREWFVWQGLNRELDQQSVLVEIHAIADRETPNAHPRPATESVDTVRAEVRAMLESLVPVKFGTIA